MGFDIYGLRPVSKRGEHFQNSVWKWPRLWKFVCLLAEDILTEEDKIGGTFNNGHQISHEKAAVIAQRLEVALKDRENHKTIIEQTSVVVNPAAEEIARILERGLNAARHPPKSTYTFSWENVEGFAEFCKSCGGFEIW